MSHQSSSNSSSNQGFVCESGFFGRIKVQRSRTRTSSRTRTIERKLRWCVLLAISLLFIEALGVANAADQASPETRLRELLRTTLLQLRAAENDKAALQAAQAESAAKVKELTEQVEALTKQSAADKDAADKAITDLKAKVADQDTELSQLKDALEKWKEGYAKAADIANAKEAERAKLASQVILLNRTVADRETKNVELFRIGNEILKRYERFGLGDALLAREPFVGIAKVKLENQVQGYQDKLLDQRIKPGQPPSERTPGTPGTPQTSGTTGTPGTPGTPGTQGTQGTPQTQ